MNMSISTHTQSYRKALIGMAAFAFGLALTVPAFGLVVTTADSGGADAKIESEFVNTNFDANGWLEVRHTKFGSRHAYLRWDLSSLSGTASAVDLDVMVGVVQSVPANMAVWGLNDGNAGEGWDETTITWNNAPGNDPTTHSSGDTTPHTDLNAAEVTLLGTLTAPSGTVVGDILTFSSAALVNFINADNDGQVTLIMTNLDTMASERSAQLMAKENTNTLPSSGLSFDPTLTITEIPEPASFVLLGMGLVGLLAYRRRS